jgi:hypothetical protein
MIITTRLSSICFSARSDGCASAGSRPETDFPRKVNKRKHSRVSLPPHLPCPAPASFGFNGPENALIRFDTPLPVKSFRFPRFPFPRVPSGSLYRTLFFFFIYTYICILAILDSHSFILQIEKLTRFTVQ